MTTDAEKLAAYDREHDETPLTKKHLRSLLDKQMQKRVQLENDMLFCGTNDGEIGVYNPTLGDFYTLCRVLNIELKEPQQ